MNNEWLLLSAIRETALMVSHADIYMIPKRKRYLKIDLTNILNELKKLAETNQVDISAIEEMEKRIGG